MRALPLFLACLAAFAHLGGATWTLETRPNGLALLPATTAPFGFPADDLDRIVDPRTAADERGKAYGRLAGADFSGIARKLASLMGTHPILTGIGPRTKQPWNESQLSEGDRIACTLHQLWEHHLAAPETRARHTSLLLDILEQPPVVESAPPSLAGDPLFKDYLYDGRHAVILQLWLRLHYLPDDPAMPPLEQTLARLARLARDPGYPRELRLRLLPILVERGDPNAYIDLAIALSDEEASPVQRGEKFRFATPSEHLDRLTPENRARYLRHSMRLLQAIDREKPSSGYFLATHIGHVANVPPVPPADEPFMPDRDLPKYGGPHGLADSFFEDTVKNALEWWEENKALYRSP